MASAACVSAGDATPGHYEGRGVELVTPGGIHVYHVAPEQVRNPKAVIVFVHDIFGFKANGNVRRSCDALAKESGIHVVMPDFFGGAPWKWGEPLGTDAFKAWWGQKCGHGDFAVNAKEVVEFLRGDKFGFTHFGLFGACWGGLMSMEENSSGLFHACGSIHGARLSSELIVKTKVPLLLLPAHDDPAVAPFLEDLAKVSPAIAAKCVSKHYGEGITHGFYAARGDLSVEHQNEARRDATSIASKFFVENLA